MLEFNGILILKHNCKLNFNERCNLKKIVMSSQIQNGTLFKL